MSTFIEKFIVSNVIFNPLTFKIIVFRPNRNISKYSNSHPLVRQHFNSSIGCINGQSLLISCYVGITSGLFLNRLLSMINAAELVINTYMQRVVCFKAVVPIFS